MNLSILKKCLDELEKAEPRKDYVVGMLETLIAFEEEKFPQAYLNNNGEVGITYNKVIVQPEVVTDESVMLDMQVANRLSEIEKLASESLE